MTDLQGWQFPRGMHHFATALHMEQIDPACVRVELPFDEWWKLWCAFERNIPGLNPYIPPASEFRYMGFTFVGRKEIE